MEALTALQWAKEGYVPNADAVGEERWTNCFHGQKATYYKDNEVHKDSETAKDMLRAKRKEHKKASDKRDEKRKKNMAYRENMKTEWQWLQEGRIPNPNARWEYGEILNNTFNVCSYGSKYCYCHIAVSYTHLTLPTN